MSDARRVSLKARIYGRVQGVGFRAWTMDRATGFGLDGWVRNRSDRTVEALFSGPPSKVEAMIEACASGPTFARVTRVEREPAEAPDHGGFHSLPTI